MAEASRNFSGEANRERGFLSRPIATSQSFGLEHDFRLSISKEIAINPSSL
jgi:hypothetical protein